MSSFTLTGHPIVTVSSSQTELSHCRSTKILELLKVPINILYNLYQDMSDEPVVESTTQSPVRSSSPQVRLHSKAEDCGSSLLAGTASVLLNNSNHTSFSDLPVGVVLQIASYLDVKSLCQLQQTSKHFCAIMSDELLWRKKLLQDSRQWPVVGHLAHPRVYQEASSDLTAQEM